MMRFKITANAPVTCFGYGLNFTAGISYTDDEELAEYLRGLTYKVEEQNQEDNQGEQTPPVPDIPAPDISVGTIEDPPTEETESESCEPLICPECGKVYKTADGLQKHIVEKHHT